MTPLNKKSDSSHHIDETILNQSDLEYAILRIVKDDPFTTVGLIVDELRFRPSETPITWWRVWNILRKNSLLSRRARFQYARGRR